MQDLVYPINFTFNIQNLYSYWLYGLLKDYFYMYQGASLRRYYFKIFTSLILSAFSSLLR